MSDPISSERWGVSAGIDALTRAVEHLETAFAHRERAASEEAGRLQEMRQEAEALRALHQAIAQRLDAAIANLKESLGD